MIQHSHSHFDHVSCLFIADCFMELSVCKWTSLPCCDPPWHLCEDPALHLLIIVCLVRLIQRTREMILDYYSCRKVALNLIVEKLHT